jgi:ribosomal protein L16 Arg81 hydroxylase
MTNGTFDLEALLDPVGPSVFFDLHWEKKPLHVQRTDVGYYSALVSLADLERLIASPDARYPAIQLSKHGAYFPAEVYTEDQQLGAAHFTGVPNVQKIAAEYRAGATIVLPGLHRTWTPLARLCLSIDSELDHVAHANAYLTPGNTAGFTPHYDTHEVLVLQISGHKHWRVYEPPIALPHRKQPFTPAGYTLPARPLLEVDLAPGDLLYLPRGYVHTTTTSAAHSAHVTIGIAVYTWLDLASELLQSAMGSPRLRAALPPGFASRGSAPRLKQDLAHALDELRGAADGDALIDRFLSRVRATKSAARDTFQAAVTVIAPDTRLTAPPPEDYQIARQGNTALVEFKQRRFVLPGDAYPALESIRRLRVFAALDLKGSLDIESLLALVRSLHDKGFLSQTDAGRDSALPSDH